MFQKFILIVIQPLNVCICYLRKQNVFNEAKIEGDWEEIHNEEKII